MGTSGLTNLSSSLHTLPDIWPSFSVLLPKAGEVEMEELSLMSLSPTPLASNNPKVVATLPYFFPICSSPSVLPVTWLNVYVQSDRAWEFTLPLSILLTRNKPWVPALSKEEMAQTQSHRPRSGESLRILLTTDLKSSLLPQRSIPQASELVLIPFSRLTQCHTLLPMTYSYNF